MTPAPALRVLLLAERFDALRAQAALGELRPQPWVRWAGSLQGLRDIVAQARPNVAMICVGTAEFDGLLAVEEMLHLAPEVPVVAIGDLGQGPAVALMKSGVSDVLGWADAGRIRETVTTLVRQREDRLKAQDSAAGSDAERGLLGLVMEHLPVGVFILDRHGAVTHVNPAARAIWDGALYTDLNGLVAYRGWHADSGQPLRAQDWAVARALSAREVVTAQRLEIESFSGRRRVILNSAAPMVSADGEVLGAVVVQEDISELHSAEASVGQARLMLQGLSQRLLDAQESERRWIAQELHDDIGQAVAAMRFQLASIGQRVADPAAAELALQALASSEQLGHRLRQICLGLRPPELDDFGVAAALRGVAASASSRELPVMLEVDGEEQRYSNAVEIAAFRIAQEAVSNAVRHSAASLVRITLTLTSQRLMVQVADDGRGFEPGVTTERALQMRRFGLAGMAERARAAGGELSIESRPGAGCVVSVQFDAEGPPPVSSASDDLPWVHA